MTHFSDRNDYLSSGPLRSVAWNPNPYLTPSLVGPALTQGYQSLGPDGRYQLVGVTLVALLAGGSRLGLVRRGNLSIRDQYSCGVGSSVVNLIPSRFGVYFLFVVGI